MPMNLCSAPEFAPAAAPLPSRGTRLAKLLASVKEVLREAIALGGSSISDYVDADGEEGFFQLQHRSTAAKASPAWSARRPSSAS